MGGSQEAGGEGGWAEDMEYVGAGGKQGGEMGQRQRGDRERT